MMTQAISSVPELCDNCQRIDLSLFLPSAELQFQDASACYNRRKTTAKTYIREPDGSIKDDSPRSPAVNLLWYSLDLGYLKAMVCCKEVCPLCYFIATMFEKHDKQEVSSLPAVSGYTGSCKVLLENIEVGIAFDEDQSLQFSSQWAAGWQLHRMSLSCWLKGKAENRLAFLAAPSLMPGSEPTLLARHQPARCNLALFNSWLQMCITSHPQCYRRLDSATAPLWLIDVVNMCLVTFISKERANAKYCALSYV
jgi:hypothetical protein